MEDSMRAFFTGWGSGDALAQSDNSRYTQYGNTALNNTGAQNREMLGHINTLQKYYMTGRGPDGQTLDQQSMDKIRDFVNAKQVPFSQGVMVPGDREVPAGMPPLTPIAPPTIATPVLPPPPPPIPLVYPNGTGPYPPQAVTPYPNGAGPAAPAPMLPQMPAPPPPVNRPTGVNFQQQQPAPPPKKKRSAFRGPKPSMKLGPTGKPTNFPDMLSGYRQGL